MNKRVGQGDPLSPKLFTAVMEEVFKKADISEGINVDGENLTNLRFADNVALFNEKTNGKTLKQSELRKSESLPKNTQRNVKIHEKPCRRWRYTNWSRKNGKSDRIQIPWTNHTPQRHHKRRNLCQDQSSVELFWKKKKKKKKEILQVRQLPISFTKTSNGPVCLANMTYAQQLTKNHSKEQGRGKCSI